MGGSQKAKKNGDNRAGEKSATVIWESKSRQLSTSADSLAKGLGGKMREGENLNDFRTP